MNSQQESDSSKLTLQSFPSFPLSFCLPFPFTRKFLLTLYYMSDSFLQSSSGFNGKEEQQVNEFKCSVISTKIEVQCNL